MSWMNAAVLSFFFFFKYAESEAPPSLIHPLKQLQETGREKY